MQTPAQMRSAGMAFLASGIAFFAVGLALRQYAFFGVASPFLTLGIVFLAKARRAR